MGYFIFRDGSKFSAYSGLTQITVESVDRVMNQYGVMFANLEYGGTSIQIPYSDVVEHNIQSGCTVIFDNEGRIIYTAYLDGERLSKVENTLICDWCHKPYKVSSDVLCRCDDSHCLSRRFSQFSHFIQALKLTPLTYSSYKNACIDGDVQTLADILDIEPYTDTRLIVTFADLFTAILPTDSGIKSHIVHDFTSKCQNRKDSILYYVKNPNRIFEDLDFKDYPHLAFQRWLQDPINNADVMSVLESPHINVWRFDPINTKVMKFEGMSIYLTGKFDITDNDNIVLTLNNYGGIVTDKFDEKVSLVLIGNDDKGMDIDAVEKAGKLSIPVYRETVFFAHNGDLMDYINTTFNNYCEVENWHVRADG
jgi:NAD-dependent DNA ligase